MRLCTYGLGQRMPVIFVFCQLIKLPPILASVLHFPLYETLSSFLGAPSLSSAIGSPSEVESARDGWWRWKHMAHPPQSSALYLLSDGFCTRPSEKLIVGVRPKCYARTSRANAYLIMPYALHRAALKFSINLLQYWSLLSYMKSFIENDFILQFQRPGVEYKLMSQNCSIWYYSVDWKCDRTIGWKLMRVNQGQKTAKSKVCVGH